MKLIDCNPIGIGTFCMGGGYYLDLKKDYADYDDDNKYIDAIRHSIELGQDHIDTAYTYGDGHTEDIVGKAIKKFDRTTLYIADKVPKSHMRKSAVVPAVKEMLRRLGIDYLDLVYIHDVNIPEPMEGYLDGLAEAVDLGLVREIGISNANLEQTKKAVAISKYPITANQIRMNLVDRGRSPEELLQYCNDQNIKVVAYVPFQNPVFFGGLDYPKIKEVANKYEKTVQQIALNWLIKHKNVIAIPKATDFKHIEENNKSLDFTITSEDLKILDNIAQDSK